MSSIKIYEDDIVRISFIFFGFKELTDGFVGTFKILPRIEFNPFLHYWSLHFQDEYHYGKELAFLDFGRNIAFNKIVLQSDTWVT